MMNQSFLEAVKGRRSYYGISKASPISDERIEEIVSHAVKHAPSAMNSQTARVVILFGQQHDHFWDMTKESLRKIVPADHFEPTEQKMAAFKNGYGTLLFFEDMSIVESLQKQYALYKDNFPVWSQQSSGMNQYIIWTALESEGLGASLQHYNEVVEDDVKNHWHIPSNWKLIAQMPFGKPIAEPSEKQFSPLEERIKVFR